MPDRAASGGITVMLVEDDAAFQADFAEALAITADIRLQAVAPAVAPALALIASTPPEAAPDVLVVDLGMPDGSGLEVIAEAHRRWPDCAVMVSTTFADQDHVIRSIESGASGYLLKDSARDQIAAEVRSLYAGGSPISPRIARQLLVRMRGEPPSSPAPAPPSPPHALSDRESQTLELIAKGFTYGEIADLMHVSRNTVMTFVRRIYGKLEVKSKTEAIFEARSHGLI
jgi:DNA-binding NarL/FixJ family response regulator